MAEKVHKVGLVRESRYLYFIDKQGDISRTVMARGDKTSKKKTATKKVKKITKGR
jgi:cytochrome oxidase Cu insertion factor (SCO1/SenC/PrrC family)